MNVTAISAMTQRCQDFTALQTTLQAGNLAGAQTAFAAFLQDVRKTEPTAGPGSLFGPGSPAGTDLQTLGNALKSADLAGAQRAFATLQRDIQTAGGVVSPTVRARRPFSHAEIANNGVEVPAGTTLGAAAQSVGRILNLKV
jgi:hypothetical protein